MPAREQRILWLAAALTSAALLGCALAGHAELLAYAAPLFLVALPLLGGRYLGERGIARLRGRMRARRRPFDAAPVVATRGARLLPRGGRLIAQALAVRPPPALAAIR